ncbi:MAG: disulfide bond formation protein B [Candidatus Accumulibacter sp.]|jgi:disulfide bond formation protein DsbB|nr:disulfide bond formation protein B [Accumulibacter sp.]
MRISDRIAFGGQAAVSLGLLAGALIIGDVFRVMPCYLCNFQRFLYMLLIFFGLCGVLLPRLRRAWALFSALTALGGVAAAAQQSWMQYAPQESIECGFSDPTPVERFVDWLGGLWPSMFMVTGLCKDKDWTILGLTLANWSALAFLALAAIALWLLFRREEKRGWWAR